ncbi:MAG: zinc-binding dehydrogenase [Aquihabitans sp.]
MRAVVCQNNALRVDDLPEPTPAEGQVRLRVLRCGICGSDLHAQHGSDEWADVAARGGYHGVGRSTDRVVYGHEFCGEIIDYGPGTRRRLPVGTRVVALPFLRSHGNVDLTGLSAHAPGAFAEQVLVQESMMMAVPDNVSTDVAALTEPLAVALHAVRRGSVGKHTVAIVVGCGPVGLAVILMLKALGVRRVVAADFAPGRRRLATVCGADLVVDPATDSPYDAVSGKGYLTELGAAMDFVVNTREKLDRLPIGWSHAWRLGERLGAGPRHPVVFECVGAPGMIENILDRAPLFSRVVVTGVCVGVDRFTPAMAINKEIDLRFVFGYTPLDFHDTLQMLANGKVDASALITGTVGLVDVADAFAELRSPDKHAKILIDPRAD